MMLCVLEPQTGPNPATCFSNNAHDGTSTSTSTTLCLPVDSSFRLGWDSVLAPWPADPALLPLIDNITNLTRLFTLSSRPLSLVWASGGVGPNRRGSLGPAVLGFELGGEAQ